MNPLRTLPALLFTPGPLGKWGINTNLIGKPGTAKTEIVKSVARDLGLPTRTVLLSVREPGDILGLPFILGDSRGTAHQPPEWALWANEQKRCVIFFDEVNTAPPAVQAAALRILAERVVGDLDLAPGVRILMAMNAVEDSAGGYDLPAAFANRAAHWPWGNGPDARAFAAYLTSLGGAVPEVPPLDTSKAEALEKYVLENWDPIWIRVRGSVAGFLEKRPDLLAAPPPSHDPRASGPWPSLRTWELAARALTGAKLHGLPDGDQEEVVGMLVSTPVGAEFFNWLSNADLPDPADVLDGKVTFEHSVERLDRTAAVLTSCAALVKSASCDRRVQRAQKLWQVMTPLAETVPDVIVGAVQALIGCKFVGGNVVEGTNEKWAKHSDATLSIVFPALQAAGMIRS